jgi:hypothetical protein
MPEVMQLPENMTAEEVIRLSKMKHLYVKYTNEGLTDVEYDEMTQLAAELSYCFAVDTKV